MFLPLPRTALLLLTLLLVAPGLFTGAVRAGNPEPLIQTVAGMQTQVFLPPGKGPFPVVIFSHGRPADAEKRAGLKNPILPGHAGYWVGKGFAVVAPFRQGYGTTGGTDIETSGAKRDASGRCLTAPHVQAAVKAGADAGEAMLSWVRQQPWANKNKLVLVGVSFGGLASVVLGGRNPPGVIAVVNFSGGTAGDPIRYPQNSCGIPEISELYAEAGRNARMPNLWLYAPNDLYWGAEVPRQWADSFSKAGGQLKFVMTEPVPNSDGHELLAKGGRLWGVPVNAFVKSLGF